MLGYLNNKLVTVALFIISKNYCYYGVSVSDKKNFDKPMSHAIIWEAILYAKSLGMNYFKLGEQIYKNDSEVSNIWGINALGISKFKKGFGGYTHVRLNINIL